MLKLKYLSYFISDTTLLKNNKININKIFITFPSENFDLCFSRSEF